MGAHVSVAMCTYNGAQFLEAQLASIHRQSRLPDELAICDDRSSDATLDIARAFAARPSAMTTRFQQNQNNLGSTKNFERAVGLCGGDIIFLSDQDDLWRPDKVARILRAFDDPDVGMAFTDAEVIDDRGNLVGRRLWESVPFAASEQRRMRSGRARDVLLRRNVVTGATMAFRASYRSLVLPISPHWVHDGWIALLIACCAKVVCFSEALTLYRVHGRQQIGVDVRRGTVGRGRALLARRQALRGDLRSSYAQICDVRERLADANSRGFAIAEGAVSAIDEKLVHLRERFSSTTVAARISAITREIANGRYFRYSSGVRSVLRDLAMQ
jgi:hypothetical protein